MVYHMASSSLNKYIEQYEIDIICGHTNANVYK